MKTKRLKIWRVAFDTWKQRFEEDFRNIPGMPADAVLAQSSIFAFMTYDVALKIESAEFEEVPAGALLPVNEDFATRNADTPFVVSG